MKFKNRSQAKKDYKISYIGDTKVSTKITKSNKINNVLTYCVYLSPHKTSGYNVCPNATKECIAGCLATSGRCKDMVKSRQMIYNARLIRTKLFFENNAYFMQWLIAEIKAVERKAIKDNMGIAVRLNGTSDIDWNNVYYKGCNIFELFPNIDFYDYTKDSKKLYNTASNYSLTLSYTGRNNIAVSQALKNGFNVAVIFNVGKNDALPKKFNGYDVIDGDITDYRVKEGKSKIVGLRWKNIADKQTNERIKQSCFAIQPDNQLNEY